MAWIFSLAESVVRILLAIAMAALLAMMLMIVGDVFMRYVFNAPIRGSYDVVEICLVVAVTFSFGAVISGAHEIAIDLIDQFASGRTVRFLRRMASLASTVVLVFIFHSMIEPAFQSYQYGEIRLELNMPVWIVWVLALVGMSGGVLASLINIVKQPGERDQPVADRDHT